jgi:hypothetical protein
VSCPVKLEEPVMVDDGAVQLVNTEACVDNHDVRPSPGRRQADLLEELRVRAAGQVIGLGATAGGS